MNSEPIITYDIEKDKEIPPCKRRYPKLKNTIAAMSKGDSFLYNGSPTAPHNTATRMGLQVLVRKEGKAYRVWLIGNRATPKPSTTEQFSIDKCIT
jgi:hypothetical protein